MKKASNLAKKINIVNSAAIKQRDKQIDMCRTVKNALLAGLTNRTYRQILKERFPEYYSDEFVIDRLTRVWNCRQPDEEILGHIEIVTEEIKNS